MPHFLNPQEVAKPSSSYAHGVLLAPHAKRIIISGQIGVAPNGKVAEGITAQTEQAFDNLLAVLKAAQMEVKDIVKVVTYCTRREDLAAMRKVAPDFGGLVQFCRDHGIETVALFCTEVERPEGTLHVRDFCPAVGVAESAAAGTTNAALTSYLVRHGIVHADSDGRIVVQAEQGHEIGRPSSIRSIVSMEGADITRLQVGGVATKVAEGQLHLPSPPSNLAPRRNR